MKKLSALLIMAVAIITFSFANQALADTNIAQGKTVTLNGTFGTNGWFDSPSTAAASTLTDGSFFEENTRWDSGSVWWNGYDNPGNYAEINLGGLFTINSFVVQADDNDSYRIEYRVGSGSWQNAWDVPAVYTYGLVTRATALSAILADSLRFTATNGDGYYSVSEIQAFGVSAPVPEPETYAMLLVGLGLIGFMARCRADINA